MRIDIADRKDNQVLVGGLDVEEEMRRPKQVSKSQHGGENGQDEMKARMFQYVGVEEGSGSEVEYSDAKGKESKKVNKLLHVGGGECIGNHGVVKGFDLREIGWFCYYRLCQQAE